VGGPPGSPPARQPAPARSRRHSGGAWRLTDEEAGAHAGDSARDQWSPRRRRGDRPARRGLGVVAHSSCGAHSAACPIFPHKTARSAPRPRGDWGVITGGWGWSYPLPWTKWTAPLDQEKVESGRGWARDSTCNSPQLPKYTPMGPGFGNCGPRYPVPRCRGAVLQALASWRNLAPPIKKPPRSAPKPPPSVIT
jgi:hypothetical protein